MSEAEHYRQLAAVCRERAALRAHPDQMRIMLGAAAEFEKLAEQAARNGAGGASGQGAAGSN